MDLIFTPVLVRCLLRPSSFVWAYDYHFLDSYVDAQTVLLEGTTHLWLPTCPTTHPLISAIRDITVVVKKVAQNPAVLASYYRQS